MIYDIIDNVVSADFNNFLLKQLQGLPWQNTGSEIIEGENFDTGLMVPTYNRKFFDLDGNFSTVNKLAFEILDKTLDKAHWHFQDVVIDRIVYNYYWPNSGVSQHQDAPTNVDYPKQFFISCLYNITENNGYNIIDKEQVQSFQSRSILFQNTDFHSAFNPNDSKDRYTLNIVFGYNSQQIAQKK
jgi:hypothetical protein